MKSLLESKTVDKYYEQSMKKVFISLPFVPVTVFLHVQVVGQSHLFKFCLIQSAVKTDISWPISLSCPQ